MREWIYGRNPVYEVLRACRRTCFRLWVEEESRKKASTSSSRSAEQQEADAGMALGNRLSEILRLATDLGIKVEGQSRQRLNNIDPGNQGVALEVGDYPYVDFPEILSRASLRREYPFILILDALQDPQNLGTLLRTAEITGVHGVLIPYRHAARVTPAVVSASSGASEYILISQVNLAQAISSLKREGVWVVGLDQGKDHLLLSEVQLDGPLALVVGNEGQGMRSLVRKSCDILLRLPMVGKLESLNAAAAGSIAVYFAWQARGFKHNYIDDQREF